MVFAATGSAAADWYLIANEALSLLTEILRLRLRMTVGAGGKARNVDSFLRKELGEALRIGPSFFSKDLTPLSSVA